jgi:hypothetical protein
MVKNGSEMAKNGKMRPLATMPKKCPTRRDKITPYQVYQKANKTQHKQNLSHCVRFKTTAQYHNINFNARQCRKNALQAPIPSAAYIRTSEKKKKPHRAKNALQGKKKSRPRKSRTAVFFIRTFVHCLRSQV